MVIGGDDFKSMGLPYLFESFKDGSPLFCFCKRERRGRGDHEKVCAV